MTPEQIKELEDNASAAQQRGGWGTVAIGADRLIELLAIAKAAIPSGQVAEDARTVREGLLSRRGPVCVPDIADDALSRLAAQAQSAENYRIMWIDETNAAQRFAKEAEEHRQSAQEWKDKAEALMTAESAHGSVLSQLARILGQKDGEATLEAAQRVVSERGVLREEIAQWKRGSQVSFEEGVTLKETNKRLTAELASMRKERNAAVADNAALLKELGDIREWASSNRQVQLWQNLNALLSQAVHPGATLLEELEQAKTLLHQRPGETLPEAIRRAYAEHDKRAARLQDKVNHLSEHVNNAQDESELTEVMERMVKDGMRAGAARWANGEMDGVGAAMDGWTMRDEFAKAAMQGILANSTTQEKPDVCARAAYIAADAMMTERNKSRVQEPADVATCTCHDLPAGSRHRRSCPSWEAEASKDVAEQMRVACLNEVQAYLDRIGLGHDVPMWTEIEQAIKRAKATT